MIDNLQALRARDDLLAVAAAWGALQARLRPAGGKGDGVRTAPESRPPIDLGVSDLLAEVEEHARFLGKVLLDEVPPEHGCDGACHGTAEHRCAGRLCATEGEPLVAARDCPMRRDPVTTSVMPGLLEQAARRYGHFTAADDKTALDFCDEAHELRRKVSGTIRSKEPSRWQGPCPEDECDGELWQRPGRIDAVCRECGRGVGPAEWREIMEKAFNSRLMPWSEIVSAFHVMGYGISRETVATWVKRYRSWRREKGEAEAEGRKVRPMPRQCLEPVVTDPDLYRWSDAYALAERRLARFDQTKHEERMSA